MQIQKKGGLQPHHFGGEKPRLAPQDLVWGGAITCVSGKEFQHVVVEEFHLVSQNWLAILANAGRTGSASSSWRGGSRGWASFEGDCSYGSSGSGGQSDGRLVEMINTSLTHPHPYPYLVLKLTDPPKQ